jgi:hypothetical protein
MAFGGLPGAAPAAEPPPADLAPASVVATEGTGVAVFADAPHPELLNIWLSSLLSAIESTAAPDGEWAVTVPVGTVPMEPEGPESVAGW